MERMRVIVAALALGLLTVAVAAADAQQAPRIARIGYLGSPGSVPHNVNAFLEGLREIGYVDGRTVVVEYRDPRGNPEQLRALTAELVALKVDVIVAPITPYALAAKRATTTIPIVFVSLDPVTSGLVSNLARPGGNLTGLSGILPELVGKWLEHFAQAVPKARRVAVLWQPGAYPERTEKEMRAGAEAAGRTLNVQLHFVEARSSADLDRAFSEMTKARAGALTVFTSQMLIRERRRIVDLATKHRLPAMYSVTEYVVEAGGLMVYGPNVPDLHRRAALYVDKILKGAQPADLPIEQPTKFELLINLKAARAIGLMIPPSVLARADRVVE